MAAARKRPLKSAKKLTAKKTVSKKSTPTETTAIKRSTAKNSTKKKRELEVDSPESHAQPSTASSKQTNDQLHLPDGAFRSLVDTNFLQYASYVIRERAIPQLEDGLKPVQRRIMHSLQENDDGKFNKVANIVGHCMRYHPHGDASIGDALVSLVNRGYLIEGQGNFGNILTGDPAAASRYIECRLTELARNEIFNTKLTQFIPSYDGRNKEPVMLPCKLPLLLMLGADGIAVGLSTKIMPHNFMELLKAQIAILQNKRFKILPDFQQGGLMDASEYNKGNGKIKLRAVIAKREINKLVINQIPYGTTTESVVASIEDAARKKKLKIRSIHDYTAEKVEILITLTQGENQDRTIDALYHFTQCEVPISCNLVVIQGEKPVQMTVDEVLQANTDQLVKILKAELELKERELENELHHKSLVQIFIENRIYKKIETCTTYEAVKKAVHTGLNPFTKKFKRPVTEEDVEMLLDLRIKRISKFDLEKNQKDMLRIVEELKEVRKHLRHLVKYAINYLQGLIDKYGKQYKRKTKSTTADEIDVRELTANQLAIVHDEEKGFIGYGIKGQASFRCSPLDKMIIIWKSGRYQVMPPPEKLFVDKDVLYFATFDRDKVFTLVFATPQASYIKKFTFGGLVMNRDYNLALPKSRILLFREGSFPKLYVKFRATKGLKIKEHTFTLADIPIRGAKTKGNQLTKKSISSVRALTK
ncbi:MAG: DNA topoisomerase IV subunit A [Verrucomicrobiota bacterium]